MNKLHPGSQQAAGDAAQARFGREVSATLNLGIDALDPAVVTRLRFARMRALERSAIARARAEASRLGATAQGAALLGSGTGWWVKLASLAPLLALAGGLLLIQQAQDRAQLSVAAEVDAALLADDLPPSAYTDPAFGEFLKLPPRP